MIDLNYKQVLAQIMSDDAGAAHFQITTNSRLKNFRVGGPQGNIIYVCSRIVKIISF